MCSDYVVAEFLPEGKGIFDYISVDGRARMHCLERALPLLKPDGGILLLDNSDRAMYQKAFDMVPLLVAHGARQPRRAGGSLSRLRLAALCVRWRMPLGCCQRLMRCG